MKYSNYVGVLCSAAVIAFCFTPWVYIGSIRATISGFRTEQTNFGLPGALHIFLSSFCIILYMLHKVWAKRLNLFIATLNFTWSIRNFLLITQCELGECPEKKVGIYAIVFLSFIMLLMALLPKLKLNDESKLI